MHTSTTCSCVARTATQYQVRHNKTGQFEPQCHNRVVLDSRRPCSKKPCSVNHAESSESDDEACNANSYRAVSACESQRVVAPWEAGAHNRIGTPTLTQFLTFHLQVTAKKAGNTKRILTPFSLEHNIRWMGVFFISTRFVLRPSSGVFYTMSLNHLGLDIYALTT